MNVDSPKHETPDFNAAIDNDFIEYAVRDTQATWECYVALIAKFDGLRLADAEPSKMYSEASLGKAGLRSMAIQSWQQCQPEFDPAITGKIMAAYFGGRSEIGIRRSERQVMLCDFLSMYVPYSSIMHGPRQDFPAYAYDLIEPERPRVYAAVLKLTRKNVFSRPDFALQDDGVCRFFAAIGDSSRLFNSALFLSARSQSAWTVRILNR